MRKLVFSTKSPSYVMLLAWDAQFDVGTKKPPVLNSRFGEDLTENKN